MRYLLDIAYLTVLLLFSPWLLYRSLTTGKYRRGIRSKLTGDILPDSVSPCLRVSLSPCPRIWFHGVSVGEIHLLRQVVAAFRLRHPDWECVISTTTDTGYDEARKHFADLAVIWWPFDFSWAVRRALRQVRPSLVVLAEGELWPNFLSAARREGMPVAVINGRMSPRSARHYRRFSALTRPLMRQVDLFAVQTEDYAAAVRGLGAPAERVEVTGSVKYDGVATDRHNARTEELHRLLAVHVDDLVWIAGSTSAPEEAMVLHIYRRLQTQWPNLRLFIAPRHRERFDEVAELLRCSGLPWVRRSELTKPVTDRNGVVLVDTIGELGPLWGLADVAFVGGSLDGHRGGQNMIEPAAFGAAVVFGPHAWNFRDTVNLLLAAEAAVQVQDAVELERVTRQLLQDAERRARLGKAGRQLVLQQQGATDRTIALLDRMLSDVPSTGRPVTTTIG